ncbi:MAG: RpiB/LacA/LacB family sugar-phosphate isomerase [Synergistaceae bacterium]|jgi:ribose 5-phosphate isomerase B|nr:RpiB/LacA/LacB family sugar-phosphate isomerase [Synergistaceae bacterium]
MIELKIAIGCDPNAIDFKAQLIPYIKELGHEVLDYGSEDPVYANVAIAVAKDVAAGKADRGVLICGTGIGVSIAANKVEGAYAALVSNIYQAQRAQLSNNANIITFGAQVMGVELAKCLVKEYLSNAYDPKSRSGPKVGRITEFEKQGK